MNRWWWLGKVQVRVGSRNTSLHFTASSWCVREFLRSPLYMSTLLLLLSLSLSDDDDDDDDDVSQEGRTTKTTRGNAFDESANHVRGRRKDACGNSPVLIVVVVVVVVVAVSETVSQS